MPDPTSDPRCKGVAVQSDLSMLQAVELTFGMIPESLQLFRMLQLPPRGPQIFVLALSLFGTICVY